MTFASAWPPGVLLAALSAEERDNLLKSGTEVGYAHGAMLIVQGERGEEVFVLLSGFVKVTAVDENGDEALLAVRSRGDLVGELAALDGAPRTATVSAIGKVVAVRVSRARFLEFLARHPPAASKILESVLAKFRAATEKRVAARSADARLRLAQVLHELATRYGEPTSEGVAIALPLTQFDLSKLAMLGESTTERVLREFRKAGLVETRYRKIVVRDLAALEYVRRVGKGT